MMSHAREHLADRLTDAADAVRKVLNDANERRADAVGATREAMDAARTRFDSAQVSLAEQLETAAAALRRNAGANPMSRFTREQPVRAVAVAFSAGAVLGVLGLLGGLVLLGSRED
jgi:ElaB/YqjD/DUF883 family membrane-anchored ribosome-binding protein